MKKTIYFIGHSHIEFFQWDRRFPEYEVYNFGLQGETVEGLLARIDKITSLEYSPPDILFIQSGGNNVAVDDLDFIGAYREIIDRLKATYPRARIIISTLLPCTLKLVSEESVRKANTMLKELAADTGVGISDSYKRFFDSSGKIREECFLPDGVHLNDEGYRIWTTDIEGVIANK
jgi:lysophospholipase L1-like esterase